MGPQPFKAGAHFMYSSALTEHGDRLEVMSVREHVQSAQRGQPITSSHEDLQVSGKGRRIAGRHDNTIRTEGRDGLHDLTACSLTRRIEDNDIGTPPTIGREASQLRHRVRGDPTSEKASSLLGMKAPTGIAHRLLLALQRTHRSSQHRQWQREQTRTGVQLDHAHARRSS